MVAPSRDLHGKDDERVAYELFEEELDNLLRGDEELHEVADELRKEIEKPDLTDILLGALRELHVPSYRQRWEEKLEWYRRHGICGPEGVAELRGHLSLPETSRTAA